MKNIYCSRNVIITIPKQILINRFLDTEIIILNNKVVKSVNRKESELPVSSESKVPEHYKRNTLLGELRCAEKISSNFQKEVKDIKEKFS